MSLQAELDYEEQSLLEYPEVQPERAWSRSRIGSEALSADAGTEFVRARMPLPQPQPTGKPRIVDSPDDHPDQHEGRKKWPRRIPQAGAAGIGAGAAFGLGDGGRRLSLLGLRAPLPIDR